MKLYLDRIEGDYCIFTCNDHTINVPKSLINEAKEGDVYEIIKSSDPLNKTKNEELVNKLFK